MLRTVYLEGKLGKLFGRKWELDVDTVREALRAIDVNTKGEFMKYMSTEGAKRYYKIGLQSKKNIIDVRNESSGPIGSSDIYIMPTIKGSGDSPWLQIVVGIVLIIVTWGAATPGVFGANALISAGTATIGYGLAASLILGGVMQLLTPVPKFDTSSSGAVDDGGSNLFQGNANAVAQGGSVGIIYGRTLVSPMPISAATNTQERSTTNTNQIGSVTETVLDGGGVQYQD